ncbi:hypothetical protein FH972_021354 [Carpinus fangiana]|uniref:DUF7082 domain-containing protein n=1 Tax=Carpinus fangiana TaxID=176857 RepID=A0A5N6KPR3_9ROSI|nr:hypothetical protein FH972_021354 [Carpinus fangiana]
MLANASRTEEHYHEAFDAFGTGPARALHMGRGLKKEPAQIEGAKYGPAVQTQPTMQYNPTLLHGHEDGHIRALAQSHSPLQILSYSPVQGPPGTVLDIRAQVFDIALRQLPLNYFVAVGSHSVWASVDPLHHQGALELCIRATVPGGERDCEQLPICLRIFNREGELLFADQFGTFMVMPFQISAWDPSRAPMHSSASGHVNVDQLSTQLPSRATMPSQGAPTDTLALAPYASWWDNHGHTNPSIFGTLAQLNTTDESSSPSTISPGTGSPISGTVRNNPATVDHRDTVREHQHTQSREIHQIPLAPRTPGQANQMLVRTSHMHQTPACSRDPGEVFNPYALYPNKAVLNIDGDLDLMAEFWDQDERANGRRLVEFKRRQSGRTLNITFKAVEHAQRTSNAFCVSCIWWEEKQEAYVTSVDTIHLLQCIIGIRFTVEEKNRIRRNLEGFHPLTVSKLKPDCETFFSLIMGFPPPKPRNIEKDVKVFPWKKLAPALQKIISKYSASPSSTAGLLPSSSVPDDENGEQHSQYVIASPAGIDTRNDMPEDSQMGPSAARIESAGSSFGYEPAAEHRRPPTMRSAILDALQDGWQPSAPDSRGWAPERHHFEEGVEREHSSHHARLFE